MVDLNALNCLQLLKKGNNETKGNVLFLYSILFDQFLSNNYNAKSSRILECRKSCTNEKSVKEVKSLYAKKVAGMQRVSGKATKMTTPEVFVLLLMSIMPMEFESVVL
jgi:hypothetical protein